MTEIRVLDTYWSDHCRHTTFSTELTEVSFGDGDYRKPMEDTYKQYLRDRSEILKDVRIICMSDGSCADGYEKAEKRRKASGSGGVR